MNLYLSMPWSNIVGFIAYLGAFAIVYIAVVYFFHWLDDQPWLSRLTSKRDTD